MRNTTRVNFSAIIPSCSFPKNDFPILLENLNYKNPYDFTKEHRHEYFEIILIEKGGGVQWIDFSTVNLYDYSCYIILPVQVHLLKRNEFSKGTVIQFDETSVQTPCLLTCLLQIENPVIFENDADAYSMVKSYLTLISEIREMRRESSKTGSIHLLQALLMFLIDFKNRQDNYRQKTPIHSQFANLVDKQFAEKKLVSEYLRELNVSQTKLTASVLKHYGVTPLQFIHNRVILEIKRLLAFGSQSQKEIAYELGFNNPSVFSQFVKTKTGYSPTELQSMLLETVHIKGLH